MIFELFLSRGLDCCPHSSNKKFEIQQMEGGFIYALSII